MSDPTLHLVSQQAESSVPIGGDDRGFVTFFEGEKSALFRALCLVTRNRAEAEELTQDAFLRVFERWDRVRWMDDPSGYLYRTAMNAFRTWHRRAALGLKRTIGLTASDDRMMELESEDAVMRALAPLSPRQRAAVVLVDLLGYSSEEAGQVLGIRAATVRTHAARAHADLRKWMGASHD
jgi:RNA polymerase sigma factor (sigma-70 family)